jgi:hypothetical protein
LSSDAQALIHKGNDLEDAGQLKEALALYEQAASLA